VDKKRAVMPPANKKNSLLKKLAPEIIVRRFGTRAGILGAIFLEHALEDNHVTGRHVNDLETDIEGRWVNVIGTTPFAARNEGHVRLVCDFAVQLNRQAEILAHRNALIAIQFEAARADIGKIADNLLGGIVQYLHVICELAAV
jgi:hypothetical protein